MCRGPGQVIVLFHSYFPPSGEESEQRILAHKSEQPIAGSIAIFHKFFCYIKHGGTCIITNLNLWNPWGHVTNMSKCHGAGVWSSDKNILRFMFKNIKHLWWCVLVIRWFATGRLGAPAFVRLAYNIRQILWDASICPRPRLDTWF